MVLVRHLLLVLLADDVKKMRDVIVAADVQQPLTFPVRAGLAASVNSHDNLVWLLDQVGSLIISPAFTQRLLFIYLFFFTEVIRYVNDMLY